MARGELPWLTGCSPLYRPSTQRASSSARRERGGMASGLLVLVQRRSARAFARHRPRPTAGAAARTGTAGPAGSVRMSALAFPLSLKLPQHSRQAAIASNRSIMPGFPRLSRVGPFHRPRPKHQVCRFQNYLVASIPLPIREPRAEHHEQSCARLQKLLRRIPLQMLTVVNLPSQCIQQIGERPVSARSHGARICCLSPQFPLPPCRLATWRACTAPPRLLVCYRSAGGRSAR